MPAAMADHDSLFLCHPSEMNAQRRNQGVRPADLQVLIHLKHFPSIHEGPLASTARAETFLTGSVDLGSKAFFGMLIPTAAGQGFPVCGGQADE